MFTVERLQDVGDQRIPVGTAETDAELGALVEHRHGTFMIHHGEKRVRWERGYYGPDAGEHFRVQLGEIVKALRS